MLTDRYIDSSLAYQGAGRDLSVDEVRRISRWATHGLTPDLTILLDIPPSAGLARARGAEGGDKLEAESLQFHEAVRRAFLRLAEADPRRYRVVDARSPGRRSSPPTSSTAVNELLAPAIEPTATAPSRSETVTDLSVWDELIGQDDAVAALQRGRRQRLRRSPRAAMRQPGR